METEEWRPVPSRPGIMASSWGRILLPPSEAAMPKGGVRKYNPQPTTGNICRSKKGAQHLYRGLWNRKYGNLKVHQLVCEAWHGPRPDGMEVLHQDEDGLNNRPSNLRWGTRKENLNAPGFLAYCRNRTGDNSPSRKAAAR
jgi:hypothetical protein